MKRSSQELMVIQLCNFFIRTRSNSANYFGHNFLRVRCTINWSHPTPCKKAEFEYLLSGQCLDFFLSVSVKIYHSPFKKLKRQPTLIILFSQHALFYEGQLNKFELKSDWHHMLPGEFAGESVTK